MTKLDGRGFSTVGVAFGVRLHGKLCPASLVTLTDVELIAAVAQAD